MIRVLPQNISNLIAAGEVVSRPASVVKELVENAIDAGATNVSVSVTDAGRTLIQVVDNGCGMSAEEARICFERHATSKISSVEDLEKIATYGFRGEAIPSIAAVSEVTLKTRRAEDETGTVVVAADSKIISSNPAAAPAGTCFSVRNLFYNVPARRKFLKSDNVELRNIIQEFTRVALIRPEVALKLTSSGKEVFNLKPAGGLKQRIRDIFGINVTNELVPINVETSVIKISGFIGNPEFALKRQGREFFFVNGRYFRSPFFHKAVCKPYENLIAPDSVPSYFIFMEVDPEKIDVNIHPAKTEVKFEDEAVIFEILMATVREGLGKNDFTPSIDFDMAGAPEIPIFQTPSGSSGSGSYGPVKMPQIGFDPLFNPFREEKDFEERLFEDAPVEKENKILILQKKFIATPVKSGMMIINIKRARERIFYEQYLKQLVEGQAIPQQTLFPVTMELSSEDRLTLLGQGELLSRLGFDIRDFGGNSIVVYGMPESYSLDEESVKAGVDSLLAALKDETALDDTTQTIAAGMAAGAARSEGEALNEDSARQIIDRLFSCREPNLTPDGRRCITILTTEEIEKRLC